MTWAKLLGSTTTTPSPSKILPSANLTKRASAYLAKMPAARSGQGGHTGTFNAARKMLDIGLSEEEAHRLLSEEYNPRCEPPWSDDDLHRKVSEAHTKRTRRPIADRPRPNSTTTERRPYNAPSPQKTSERRLHLTDLGNTGRLVGGFGDDLRYSPQKRVFFFYDEQRWKPDITGQVYRWAATTVRGIYKEAANVGDAEERKAVVKHAAKSESATAIEAMVKLTRHQPGVPILVDELDTDPWLLNVLNGTIDLRTGQRQPHSRDDLITKMVPIAYDPGATHPVWTTFLKTVTGGDDDFAAYLQRLAGYLATGLTHEKSFWFLYGPTDTAKSTFMEALRNALGDYAMVADFDTWLARRDIGGNRGDLARLHGARAVFSSEVPDNARFDAKLVKAITGGDPLTVAAKYEAEFCFTPTFKIVLGGNRAPIIHEEDQAMFLRCQRLPFNNRIAKENQDPEVRRALTDPNDAGPAILAWIVAGCQMWQRDGLAPPEAVQRSSAEYRGEMDIFQSFLDDRCEMEPTARATKAELRAAYEQWCEGNGIRRRLSMKAIASRFAALGISPGKSGPTRFWCGLRLLPDCDS